jgi:hypothetical protein
VELEKWLDEHLEDVAIRNAPALILDFRGNEGGDDVGNEIIPHLIGQPITLSSMRRLVRYRTRAVVTEEVLLNQFIKF